MNLFIVKIIIHFFNQIVVWRRYIDYVFVILKNEASFIFFAEWLNTIHESIKFVGEYNN